MKLIKIIATCLVLTIFSACEIGEEPIHDMYSTVNYLSNPLDYSVRVERWYLPKSLNFNKDSLIKYERDVIISPGEQEIVSDYIRTTMMRIYSTSKDKMLYEMYEPTIGQLFESTNQGISRNYANEKQIGRIIYNEETYPEAYINGYYVENEKYMTDNIPMPMWYMSIYTDIFWGDDEAASNAAESTYEATTNGYALVRCFKINPEAECFKIGL